MKNYLLALIFGSLVVTVILQGFLFSTTSLQTQKLENQLNEVSLKLDKVQSTVDGSVLTSIDTLKQEVDLYSTKMGTAQTIAVAQADPTNLLSNTNLSKTLGAGTDISPTTNPLSLVKKIKLTANWKTANAFVTNQPGSTVSGQLVPGKEYEVISAEPGWYQIQLNTMNSPWVESKFVYETN